MTSTIAAIHPSDAALVASGGWLPAALPVPNLATGTTDLVSSARTLTGDTDGGVRWTQGFTVVADACGAAIAIDPCDLDPDPQTFPGITHYATIPYLLIAGTKCSTFGITPDAMTESARRILNSGSASAAIERQMWGDATVQAIATNPKFTTTGVVAEAGARSAIAALATLEQVARVKAPGLGRYMIHASPRLVTLWSAGGGLRKVGNTILTVLDTVVVAGGGYDVDTGPAAAAATAGTEWAFITGIVTVHLGDVLPMADTALTVDRGSNNIVAMAARFAAATWPPCLPPQGVLVTIPTS